MYFEEFTPQTKITTPTRTITLDDIESFIKLSGLANPLFMSDQGAQARGHAQRLAPAPLQLSLAMGLCQQAGLFDHVVAVLGFDRMRFLKPVHPGHSISLKAAVLRARPTTRPDRGLVVLGYEMLNQNGEAVMRTEATYLMARRPSD